MKRFNVTVIADFTADGQIVPRKFKYEDRWFDIERVIQMQPMSTLKTGGDGVRYMCQVEGRRTFIYLRDYVWEIEG